MVEGNHVVVRSKRLYLFYFLLQDIGNVGSIGSVGSVGSVGNASP